MGIILTSTGLPLLSATRLVARGAAAPVPQDPGAGGGAGGGVEQGKPVSQFTYDGVTVTLSKPMPVYMAANGEPVIHSTEAFDIVSITPESFEAAADFVGDRLWRHGAMLNPNAGRVGDGGLSNKNGFDGRSKTGSKDILCYDDTLNVDPGRTGSPLSFAAGSSGVVMKGVSETVKVFLQSDRQRSRGVVNRYIPISVVADAPPAGAFRPPVRGAKTTPANRTLAVMRRNMGIFGASLDVAGWPHHSASSRSNRLAAIKKTQYTLTSNWLYLGTHWPFEGLETYGRHWAGGPRTSRGWGHALCDLHSSDLSLAEKEEIAIAVCQAGIDLYGAWSDGLTWQENGGWSHGRMGPVLFAGLLLEDQGMVDSVLNPKTGERQPWVEQRNFQFVTDFEGRRTDHGWVSTSLRRDGWGVFVGASASEPTSGGRHDKVAHVAEHVGLPTWDISVWAEPVGNTHTYDDHGYRMNFCGSDLGQALSMMLLNLEGADPMNTAASTADMEYLEAMFAFYDLFCTQTEWQWKERDAGRMQHVRGLERFSPSANNPDYIQQETMREEVSAYLSVPLSPWRMSRWTGRPDQCFPPYMAVAGRDVTVTFFPWEWSIQADRWLSGGRANSNWNKNGSFTRSVTYLVNDTGTLWTKTTPPDPNDPGWVVAATGLSPSVPSYTIPGLPANTQVAVRVRITNANGDGAWSVNHPNSTGSGTEEASKLRGVITTEA